MVVQEQQEQYIDTADVRGVFGDQRKGKSTIATAWAVDDYIEHMTGLVSLDGQERTDGRCLTDKELDKLERKGIEAYKATHCMIYSDDHSDSQVIKFPANAIIESPIKIFANYSLYGVYYVPLDLETIIERINTDLITDAWVLMDESGLTDARNAMTREGKLMAQFGSQVGKRGLHLVTIAQYYEQIERRYKLFKTTTVHAMEYDKVNHIITAEYKVKGEPAQTSEIYAKPYHRYFNTREIVKMPQHQIDAAMQKISGG